MKKTMFVYDDRGATADSVNRMCATLRQLAPYYHLDTVNARDVKAGKWCTNAALIAFGGGRTMPWREDLNHEGSAQIVEYVAGGGSYLGSCAGGYHGCPRTEFAVGTPHEIIRDDGLPFANADAIGPLYGYDYNSRRYAQAAPVQWLSTNEVVPLYCNGGCSFRLPVGGFGTETEVLACYTDMPDSPAAIIATRYGQGRVVLSGVHFEFPPPPENDLDPHIAEIKPILQASNEARLRIGSELLNRLGLKTAHQLKVA